jgi:predicted ATPase
LPKLVLEDTGGLRPVVEARNGFGRYVVTGAPGAGKTLIIRKLAAGGYSVVEEAATDLIFAEQARGSLEPWTHPRFIEDITRLQIERCRQARESLQFHDRSIICTLALARYLDFPAPTILMEEIARCADERFFQRDVFFVESLGFIEPTAARRISLEESRRFERVHEETYLSLGFRLVCVPAAPVADRVAWVLSRLAV